MTLLIKRLSSFDARDRWFDALGKIVSFYDILAVSPAKRGMIASADLGGISKRAGGARCANLSTAVQQRAAWKHPLALPIRSEKHVIATYSRLSMRRLFHRNSDSNLRAIVPEKEKHIFNKLAKFSHCKISSCIVENFLFVEFTNKNIIS